MSSRVGKWGGSLSVRLPKNIVELLAISAGDTVRVRLSDNDTITITITPINAARALPAATPSATGSRVEEPLKW